MTRPDPADLIKTLQDQGGAVPANAPSAPASTPASQPTGSGASAPATVEAPRGGGGSEMAALAIVPQDAPPAPVTSIKTLEDVVSVLEQQNEVLLASQVFQYVHLVKLEQGRLEIHPEEEAPPNLAQNLGQALSRITDNRWIVSVSSAPGAATLAQDAAAALEAERAEILELPIMKEVMSVFPEAEIQAIKQVEDKG